MWDLKPTDAKRKGIKIPFKRKKRKEERFLLNLQILWEPENVWKNHTKIVLIYLGLKYEGSFLFNKLYELRWFDSVKDT